jgi:hypothetical protein
LQFFRLTLRLVDLFLSQSYLSPPVLRCSVLQIKFHEVFIIAP